MERRSIEVADIFRRYGEAYRAQAGPALSTGQRRVMTAIEQCRTAALGGHVERCDGCGHTRVWFNSCRDRHCPHVFADHLQPARQTEWVVYAKRPFAGPQQVFDYVGR